MKRGKVRWYTFRAPDKRCPILVLTRDSALSFLNSVTVAPITTTVRDIPAEVYLTQEDGHGCCKVCHSERRGGLCPGVKNLGDAPGDPSASLRCAQGDSRRLSIDFATAVGLSSNSRPQGFFLGTLEVLSSFSGTCAASGASCL